MCKKVAGEKRKAQDRLKLILEKSFDGVYALDNQQRCLFVNDSGKSLLGYEEEDLHGLKLLDLILRENDRDSSEAFKAILQTLETGQEQFVSHALFYQKNGAVFPVRMNIYPLHEDSVQIGAVVFFQDTSKILTSSKLVKRSITSLALVEDGAGIGFWEWDIIAQEFSMSERMKTMLGDESLDSIVNVDILKSHIHHADHIIVQDVVVPAIESCSSFSLRVRVILPDNEERLIESYGLVEGDEAGNAVWVSGVSIDVTDRVQLEEEVEDLHSYQEKLEEMMHKQSLELKELLHNKPPPGTSTNATLRFITGMSHDLRTPLNSILGFAQLQEVKEKKAGKGSSGTQILKSGKHLLRLITDIIDFAKIEAKELKLTLEPIPLSAMLREVIDISLTQAEQQGVVLEHDLQSDDQGSWVMADRSKVRQAMVSLISQLVSWCSKGEIVRVTNLKIDEKIVSVQVMDIGSGLPLDRVTPLFQEGGALEQGKEKMHELELGIAIAKKLIEEMQGTVKLEQLGEGVAFTISLPICEPGDASATRVDVAKKEEKNQPVASENSTGENYTILNVEDNAANRQLVRSILKKNRNYRLIEAESGAEGVKVAHDEVPDCILMDITLPDMSGIDALAELKQSDVTKSIPVIAVSGKVGVDDVEKGLGSGFIKYIEKPLNVAEFRRAIEEVLTHT